MRTDLLPPYLRDQDPQILARARRGLGGSVETATGAGVMLAVRWAIELLGDDEAARLAGELDRSARAPHGLDGTAWSAMVLALNAPYHGVGHREGASLGQATGRTLRGLRAAGRTAEADLLEHRAMAWLGAYEPASPVLHRLARTLWRHDAWLDYEQLLRDLVDLATEERRESTLREISEGVWGRAVRPDDDPEEMVSTRAVAEAVRRQPRAVAAACRAGLLVGAERWGSEWRIPPRYLDPGVYADAVQEGRRGRHDTGIDTEGSDD